MAKTIYDINFYEIKDKSKNTRDMVEYMFDRTLTMFKWENLPDTIPQRSLELFLQYNGFVFLTDKVDGKPRIFYGGLGGEPDYLYRPTLATIANPALKYNAQLKINWDNSNIEDSECVIGLNDYLLRGLLPIHQKYASEIAENEVSMWVGNILTRTPWVLSAQDPKTRESAEDFIKQIFDGNLSVIQENIGQFFEGIKEHQLSTSQTYNLGGLVQLHQYYKAEWFNFIGLNAMQNGVKKEAISVSEEQMNQDVLKPLVDSMLELRQDFCDRVNKKYDLDISVEFDSSWYDNQLELELAQEALEISNEEETMVEESTGEEANEEESNVEENTEETIEETTEEATEEETERREREIKRVEV